MQKKKRIENTYHNVTIGFGVFSLSTCGISNTKSIFQNDL